MTSSTSRSGPNPAPTVADPVHDPIAYYAELNARTSDPIAEHRRVIKKRRRMKSLYVRRRYEWAEARAAQSRHRDLSTAVRLVNETTDRCRLAQPAVRWWNK